MVFLNMLKKKDKLLSDTDLDLPPEPPKIGIEEEISTEEPIDEELTPLKKKPKLKAKVKKEKEKLPELPPPPREEAFAFGEESLDLPPPQKITEEKKKGFFSFLKPKKSVEKVSLPPIGKEEKQESKLSLSQAELEKQKIPDFPTSKPSGFEVPEMPAPPKFEEEKELPEMPSLPGSEKEFPEMPPLPEAEEEKEPPEMTPLPEEEPFVFGEEKLDLPPPPKIIEEKRKGFFSFLKPKKSVEKLSLPEIGKGEFPEMPAPPKFGEGKEVAGMPGLPGAEKEFPEMPPLPEEEGPMPPLPKEEQKLPITPKPIGLLKPVTEPQLPLTKEEPIKKQKFITINDFEYIQNNINNAKNSLKNIDSFFVELEEDKSTKDKKYAELRNSLYDIHRKITFIDKTLFEEV